MKTKIIVELTMKNVFTQEYYKTEKEFSLTDPFANLDAQGFFNFIEILKNNNLTGKSFQSVKEEFIRLTSQSRSKGLLSPKIEEMFINGVSNDEPMSFLNSFLGNSVDGETLNEVVDLKLYYV